MIPRGTGGQGVVEAVLALLLLVVLLLSFCSAAVSTLLKARGESLSFASALRHGRGLPPQDEAYRREVLGEGTSLAVARWNGDATPVGIPLPVRLCGRTGSTVTARQGRPSGSPSILPALAPGGEARSEVACDSWHEGTHAGRKIRKAVTTLVALGWIP